MVVAAPGRPVRSLFQDWNRISSRILRARRILLLLDFDGTLVPIAPTPAKVRLGASRRRFLAALARDDRITVAVVSGRALKDLVPRVGIDGITYVGVHGAEMRDRRGRQVAWHSPTQRRRIAELRRQIGASMRDVSGVLLEDKGPVLAVHYRGVPRTGRDRLFRVVDDLLHAHRSVVVGGRGKAVIEIRSRGLPHKGDAVRRLLSRSGERSLAIYFGDDETDDDAFRALKARGITVQVGTPARPLRARYRVDGPRDVWRALARLHQGLRARDEAAP